MLILTLTAAFLAGILIASRYGIPLTAIGMFGIAAILLAVLLINLRRSPRPALILAALLLGMLRVEVSGSGVSELAAYHSRLPVQVEGVVTDYPEPAGAFTRLRLRVEKVKTRDAWTEASGDVQVTLRESAAIIQERERPFFRYGDRLLLKGPLEAPPVLEDFDYPAYLYRQGIGSVMPFPKVALVGKGEGMAFYNWLYDLRHSIADSLARAVPEPQAAVAQALLLGIGDNLSDELKESFRATGTSHVLAISGMHVSILLGISLAICQRILGRRRQLYLAAPLALMWLYALLSGATPSAIRACIMGTVYLAALCFGRPRSVLPALGFAAAVMVAVNPDVLWSVSFQLSFAAMAGIALLTEPLSQWLQMLATRTGSTSSRNLSATLLTATSDITAMSLAATVATLPLIAFYFHKVSLVGMPGTLLVMPALPFALVSQALAGLVGLLGADIAQPFGWLAWAATAYITGIVEMFARIPGASVETGKLAPLLASAYYGAFAGAFVITRLPVFRTQFRRLVLPLDLPQPVPLSRAGVPLWVIAPAIGVAAIIWTAALARPDSMLHVAFVDVGQGDAAFIVTPDGQQILVDGGPDPLDLVRFMGDRMPFNDRSVELVVLTHAHSDHANGLIQVLRRYDVQRILEREVEYDSPSYQEWRHTVEAEGANVIRAQAGQVIALDSGVLMQVLNPPDHLLHGTASDIDNASVVLRLAYGELSFLLTGDTFRESDRIMTAQGISIDSDVLKVAHHGSRSSSTGDFIASVSPTIAVISAGEENRFDHPHAETIEIMRQYVSEELLLLTADNGTIEFITDGTSLKIKTER